MLRNAVFPQTLGRMGWREKLTRARKARGLSQKDLSRRIDVRQATVSSWESSEANAGINDLLRALEILDVDPAWIFSRGSDTFPTEAERTVRAVFEAKLQTDGPDSVLRLLIGSTAPARDLGEVELPHQTNRQPKRTHRPADPPVTHPRRGSLPRQPSAPHEVKLDHPAARKKKSPPGPKRQR